MAKGEEGYLSLLSGLASQGERKHMGLVLFVKETKQVKLLWLHDTQHNDTQHNDIQHNGNQYCYKCRYAECGK